MFTIAENPFTTRKRGELTGHTHAIGLVADDAILGIQPLTDHLGIRWRCYDGPSSCPVHGIAFVDILTESPAVEGEIEAAPEQRQHESPHEPWGDGTTRLVISVFLMVMLIVIHGWKLLFGGCRISLHGTGLREGIIMPKGHQIGDEVLCLIGRHDLVTLSGRIRS